MHRTNKGVVWIHEAGQVTRYHTIPGINQTNADHSWGVAMLIAKLHPNPSVELLKAALFHDVAEKVTGDVPYTTKNEFSGVKEAVDRAEKEVLRIQGLGVNLTEDEASWLKACDMLELVMYSAVLMHQGNKFAEEPYVNGLGFLKSSPRTPKEIWDVLP